MYLSNSSIGLVIDLNPDNLETSINVGNSALTVFTLSLLTVDAGISLSLHNDDNYVRSGGTSYCQSANSC